LKDVPIIQRKIMPSFNQPMAAVITRAVETIDQTLARVEGCLQQNGQMIFMKGPECDAEIEKAMTRFGHRFTLIEDRSYRIGQTENLRRLVVFKRTDVPVHIRAKQATQRHRISVVASETNVRFKAMKKLLTSRGIKKASQALMSGQRQVREMVSRFPDRCLAWISSGEKNPPPENGPENMQWMQLTEALFQQLDIFGTKNVLLCIQVPPIRPWEPLEGFMPGCNLLVPFQDPDNIGAVIRSAAAFGVSQVILLAESAHPYHPKSLRASGGTVPAVEMRTGPALEALPDTLPILALSAEGTDIGETRFPASFGLLAGMEGPGVPQQWRSKALRIPIQAGVESLNAASAVAIALYEWSQSAGR
jgi:tRNA G18 (ribose-2'-O)-methylase SpoU